MKYKYVSSSGSESDPDERAIHNNTNFQKHVTTKQKLSISDSESD